MASIDVYHQARGRATGGTVQIDDLCTKPSHQRRGCARALITQALQRLPSPSRKVTPGRRREPERQLSSGKSPKFSDRPASVRAGRMRTVLSIVGCGQTSKATGQIE
ncbi:MAG: GNAT family N-acetyltransferase [Micromonosporaceae bacterium]|nr:GNAT family N-acetyltransferase [Micromonosporaceae bacterium]